MRFYLSISLLFLGLLFSGCGAKKIKDISYASNLKNSKLNDVKLNIFTPRKAKKNMPVLIFVHGGNWNTGNKNTYGFLGRNFAKNDVLTLIPDYTLSPTTDYDGMATQIAASIKWAIANCEKYGGDPKQIYLTGHSAGGHLVALAALNPKYGIDPNLIAGIILNDAAGLDMKNYLENEPPTTENDYLATWSDDSKKWQDASPVYFLNEKSPPFLTYVGEKTYQSIKVANQRFLAKLLPLQPNVKTIYVNKKHVPMVLQYFYPWSNRYDEIIDFIQSQPKKSAE